MAFDQNPSLPKDMLPVNAANEELRLAPVTTVSRTVGEGYLSSPVQDGGSPHSIPMYYHAPVSDVGYGGLGYANAIPRVATQWYPRASVPQVGHHISVNPAPGFCYRPSIRVGGNAVNQLGGEVATSYAIGSNLGTRFAANAIDQIDNEVSTSFSVGCNFVGSGVVGNVVENTCGNGFIVGSAGGIDGNELEQVRSDSKLNFMGRSGITADQISEESGEGSISGRKVKFLCSFGGKILPRPSDGMLRYVGGQTRIITLRRDASFNELLQKMMDIYGQPVAIKYQLPDEDLDALVSVSCPDDLDNMMEEYEKLVERSSDGSVKLRVFLFSASELDPASIIQFDDLHDSGQRYYEAINGMIMDGVGGGITRKESIASATSTQNSDVSGNEAVDSSMLAQSKLTRSVSTGPTSPKKNLDISDESSKLFFVDPSPAAYSDSSNVGVGSPAVPSGASQVLPSQQPLPFDLQQSGLIIPPSAPYMHSYVDPIPNKKLNHAVYAPPPPMMGFPNTNLVAATGPVYAPQQFPDSSSNTHEFISPVQPSIPHPYIQPSVHPQIEHDGQRFVLLPVEQRYNTYQMQVPSGGYGWRPVYPPQGQVVMPGGTPHRLEGCHMCERALPHAHSDTLVKDQRGDAQVSPVPATVFHSLPPQQPLVPPESHIKQEILTRPINVEASPVPQFQELPQEYYKLPPIVPKISNLDSSNLVDNARPVDHAISELRSNEMTKQKAPQNPPGEQHHVVAQSSTYTGSEVPYMRDFRPLESSDGPETSNLGIPGSDIQSQMGTTGVGSAFATEGLSTNAAWMDDTSLFQPMMASTEIGVVPLNLNPQSRTEDLLESSNSFFVNQDPFNMNNDSHFPPKPVKIALRKEAVGNQEPFLDGPADQPNSNAGKEGAQQPFNNPVLDFSSDEFRTSKGLF